MFLGAIGAGHMGMVILDSFVKHSNIKAADILVYEIDEKRRQTLKSQGYALAEDEACVFAESDILLLAVTPQQSKHLLEKLSACAKTKPVIFSIMAGINSDYIRKYLGQDTAVICAMPTMAMKTGHGSTALSHTANSPAESVKFVLDMFNKTGEAIIADEAALMEIVGVGGCMPGYVYFLLDAFAEAASAKGIDYKTALRMAAFGFIGAAGQVLETENPKELISQICTPGGLTAQGIDSLKRNQVDKLIYEALCASIKRGYDLADEVAND